MRALLHRAADNALGVLFPPLCILCDAPRPAAERWFCAGCLGRLQANMTGRNACPRCGLNRTGRQCACHLAWDHPFESAFALFDYDDTVKAVVHEVKYGGKSRLAFHVGRRFGPALPASVFEGVDAVTAVPLHLLRRLRRGYNQADCFARGVAAGRGNLPHLGGVVRRCRHTATQTRLDRDERRRNLAGAFSVPSEQAGHLAGKRILLVDDVVTTGATTGECTQALLAAGAKAVRVLSMARD